MKVKFAAIFMFREAGTAVVGAMVASRAVVIAWVDDPLPAWRLGTKV